jgi:hypothetical protein
MRESTGRGPTVDLSEFERRLRGAEPVSQSKADPLSELARLMDGEDKEASAERYGRVFAAPPAAAPAEFTEFAEWVAQSRKPAAAGGAAKAVENTLAAAFRGSLAPDAAEAEQAWAPSRGPGAAYGGAYRDQGQPPPAPPRAEYRKVAPQAPVHQPPAYREPIYPAREYPETDPRGTSYAGQADADGPGHGGGHASTQGAPPPPATGDEWPEDSYGQDSYGQDSYGQDSYGYDDYGPEDDAGYPLEEPASSRARQWLRFKPWYAIAGVATLAVVSIGWGFAHRGGVDGPRDIATINAPEGPAKLPPAAVADQGGGQGAAVLDRNENAPVNKMVSHEEQAVDPKAAPYDPGPLAPSEPKKVKTVSVRPDGSVIENEAVPPAVANAAHGGSSDGALSDGALKAAAGKSGGTPMSAAKPATTPRVEKTVGAAPAKPKTAPKVAVVEENAAPIDDAATAAAPTKVSGGSFAVQFGAANSESEARALMVMIAGKYRAQLGGRRPTFKMAKVDGKTVYRVRVGGVSKESATGICEKIKSSGGSCFIAGN